MPSDTTNALIKKHVNSEEFFAMTHPPFVIQFQIYLYDLYDCFEFKIYLEYHLLYMPLPGIAYWLRRCATSRTVPGSIPGGVTGFFSDIFPSDRTMALESTQPLVKMSTRNIPRGKGGRCVRLTTYHHAVPLSRNLGAFSS